MKPRILIVDDDSTITQQLYWTLCDEYDVITANDMQTAIRRATFYKPDISILDLQMPPDKDSPTSGLRLLEYIKGHLSNSRVPIPKQKCADSASPPAPMAFSLSLSNSPTCLPVFAS
jgi:DNA-binding response OmpR family regulator